MLDREIQGFDTFQITGIDLMLAAGAVGFLGAEVFAQDLDGAVQNRNARNTQTAHIPLSNARRKAGLTSVKNTIPGLCGNLFHSTV